MERDPERGATPYKIVLCHRRRDWLGGARFHRHFHEAHRRLAIELAADLGYSHYAQLHQVCHANPLYQGIRATRGPLVTRLLAWREGVAAPAWSMARAARAAREAERWDVVEELWYPSRAALLAALGSRRGRSAARCLVEARAPWVQRTAAVIAEERVAVAPAPASRPVIRTLMCLRRAPRLTREQMQAYWAGGHRELVLRLRDDLGYVGYDLALARRDRRLDAVAAALGGAAASSAPPGPGAPLEGYDGIAGLSFPSQQALLAGLLSPRAQRANLTLAADELGFVDAARSALVFGERGEVYAAEAAGEASLPPERMIG